MERAGLLLLIALAASAALYQAAAQSLPPMTPQNTLYTAIITSTPLLSNESYNPNVFSPSWKQYGLTYAYLAMYNLSNGEWIPDLADNWTIQWITSGPLAGWVNITIHLRKSGWSDGTPFTCWDVWAQNLVQALFFDALGNVTVINNYTCSILAPPGSFPVNNTNLIIFYIISDGGLPMFINYRIWKPLVDNISNYWNILYAANFGVGTSAEIQNGTAYARQMFQYFKQYKPQFKFPPPMNGPFYVCKVTPAEYVLCKNPYYWDAENIAIDYIVVYQFGSTAQLIPALKTGQITVYVGSFPPSVASQLLQNPYNHYALLTGAPGFGLYFNFLWPYINYTQVRQALIYAMDINAAVQAAGPPLAPPFTPLNTLVSPAINPRARAVMDQYFQTAQLPLINYTYDPQKAAQLLESVGFKKVGNVWYAPDGKPFTLTMYVSSNDASNPQTMAVLSTIASQLTNFGISTSIYIFPEGTWPKVVSTDADKYALLFRYMTPGFSIIVPSLFPVNGYFTGYPINITHWNGVVTLPISITLPNGTVIPAGTQVRLFGGGSILGICSSSAPGNYTAQIQCIAIYAWLANNFPWFIHLYTPYAMVWYNDQYFQFPPSNSWVWSETPSLEIAGPFWWSIVTSVKPGAPTTTTTTTPTVVTVTTTYSTTVVSGTTTTVPVTVTASVSTTVSAVPSWVWGVMGLLIVVIIVVAVLALRRK
jgi:peptide/nickel transport system substrate-binding protein